MGTYDHRGVVVDDKKDKLIRKEKKKLTTYISTQYPPTEGTSKKISTKDQKKLKPINKGIDA